jgi:hypothetical protein
MGTKPKFSIDRHVQYSREWRSYLFLSWLLVSAGNNSLSVSGGSDGSLDETSVGSSDLGTLLGDLVLFLGGENLDVARRRQERSNSTVSSVGSSSALCSSVDLNVAEDELLSVKALDLSVGFEVGQKVEDDLHGFCWPSTYRKGKVPLVTPNSLAWAVLPVAPAYLL